MAPADPLRLELRFHIPASLGARVDRRRIRKLCAAVLGDEGVGGPVSLSVILVDDREIAELNARHRGHATPTDVLSFPLDPPSASRASSPRAFARPPGQARELGDVVVSFPRAVAQAAEYGHSVDRELGYLIAHGLLHILGHDHEDEGDRALMRAREEAALAAVGLNR
ncbi:MAG TPA: rRNA maturation RNase YbeY [Chloroflexota bacterium]|nr:rRNA maturation RNase YbeY [Chloroflexota bacterium]